jgi:hypothetical protein
MRVLWRFRVLMAVGAIFALALAILSFVRVSPGGDPMVSYRAEEQWITAATLFVTQRGFPWGRLTIETPEEAARRTGSAPPASGSGGTEFADPSRFSNLAVLYAYLATSDPVRSLLTKAGPMNGEIVAEPVTLGGQAFAPTLPLIRLSAIAATPEGARDLVIRATDAFQKFLADQQASNEIPDDQRVLVSVVKRAEKPQLLAGRSLTLPIVVFMGVMILVSGLAFVLENVRSRGRPVAADEPTPVSVARDAA